LNPFIPDEFTGAMEKAVEDSAAACLAEIGGRFWGLFGEDVLILFAFVAIEGVGVKVHGVRCGG